MGVYYLVISEQEQFNTDEVGEVICTPYQDYVLKGYWNLSDASEADCYVCLAIVTSSCSYTTA